MSHGSVDPSAVEFSPPHPTVDYRSRRLMIATPLHSGIGVRTYFSLYAQASLFPLIAGIIIYGWRAVGTITAVLLSTIPAAIIWRRIGSRGWQVRISHCLWLALMLGLMLPAHLFSTQPAAPGESAPWPILPAAAITLVILSWILGGIGAERIHPSLAALLIIFILFQQLLIPRHVLRVDHLIVGDLLRANPIRQPLARKDPWLTRPPPDGYDSLTCDPTREKLVAYTSAQQQPDRASLTPQMLIRDQMPPLEDLIIAGQPGPIGTASAVAVIIGGLYLLYHGLIDFRLPLFGTLAAMVTLLILPIPVVITDAATEWRWFAFRDHYLGWSTALTLVNYEILASPLLFTLFFLASNSSIRPITRRGRSIFAIVTGILSAVFLLYESVAIGPYIALLLASLLTPTLDRLLGPRTLVQS